MRWTLTWALWLGLFSSVFAQEPPVYPLGRPNPNKLIELQENIADVRDIHRNAKVKVIKEFFQQTTSEPKIIVSRTWIDPQGRLTRKVYYEGKDTVDVTDYSYDANGLLSVTVNRTYGDFPDIFRTEYTYDAQGRLVTAKGIPLGRSALGELVNPKVEQYEYDASTGQIFEITRTGREREKYVFSVDSAAGQVFKACYTLGKDSDKLAPDQDPYAFFVFTFDAEGEVYLNEYYDRDQLAFRGEYVYRGPGQFMATKTRELPHKAVRSNYSYDAKGLLLQIQNTDGSLTTFEYEYYK
jgi:hypothetical protein